MITHNFNDMLINSNSTIKDAMKKLDIVASKILFVVCENNILIGSVTDGDIRRFILSNGSIDENIKNVCNENCFKILEVFDNKKIISEMKELDISYAPILNNLGSVIDIFTLPLSNRRIIKHSHEQINIPAVIMAGGKGTRMIPFTTVLPKPLIPIGEKTILELIIDEFKVFGIKDYYFTINFRGEMIKAYFDCIEKDYTVNYIKETKFFGTAGSLKLLSSYIDSSFIVSNCDIIVKADICDVYKFHKDSDSMLTLISSIQHHTIPYGVVEFGDGGIVSMIKEKPDYSFPINTGVYILEPECLQYIPDNQEFHMTHLIDKLISEGKKVCTYPINESEYIDIGQWEEYRSVVNKMKIDINDFL